MNELEQAVIAKEPDLMNTEYVKRCLAKNLASLAGAPPISSPTARGQAGRGGGRDASTKVTAKM